MSHGSLRCELPTLEPDDDFVDRLAELAAASRPSRGGIVVPVAFGGPTARAVAIAATVAAVTAGAAAAATHLSHDRQLEPSPPASSVGIHRPDTSTDRHATTHRHGEEQPQGDHAADLTRDDTHADPGTPSQSPHATIPGAPAPHGPGDTTPGSHEPGDDQGDDHQGDDNQGDDNQGHHGDDQGDDQGDNGSGDSGDDQGDHSGDDEGSQDGGEKQAGSDDGSGADLRRDSPSVLNGSSD